MRQPLPARVCKWYDSSFQVALLLAYVTGNTYFSPDVLLVVCPQALLVVRNPLPVPLVFAYSRPGETAWMLSSP